jgi:hypothetical protein
MSSFFERKPFTKTPSVINTPLTSIIERSSKGEERNLGNIISIVKDNKVVQPP